MTCLILVFIGCVFLTIAGSFGNTETKRNRKMKAKNISDLCKYRRMMAFYREYMDDFVWLNRDIESVLQGKFINDEDY